MIRVIYLKANHTRRFFNMNTILTLPSSGEEPRAEAQVSSRVKSDRHGG